MTLHSNASRPIKPTEVDECKTNGVDYVEIPIAFDGLSVMVNPGNDFVSCLKVDDLKKLWQPEAQGKVTSWSQVRKGWPDKKIGLYGPGTGWYVMADPEGNEFCILKSDAEYAAALAAKSHSSE